MIVLDAPAALAYLLSEPGGALVRQDLAQSAITTVNLSEVARRLRRSASTTTDLSGAVLRGLDADLQRHVDDPARRSKLYNGKRGLLLCAVPRIWELASSRLFQGRKPAL